MGTNRTNPIRHHLQPLYELVDDSGTAAEREALNIVADAYEAVFPDDIDHTDWTVGDALQMLIDDGPVLDDEVADAIATTYQLLSELAS